MGSRQPARQQTGYHQHSQTCRHQSQLLKDQLEGIRSVGIAVFVNAELFDSRQTDESKGLSGLKWATGLARSGPGYGVTRSKEDAAASEVSGSVANTLMRGVPSSC